MTSVRVFVPGSIGNVGPGFDVLGLAVDGIGDRFTVELTTAPSSIAVVTGRDHTLVPTDPANNCTSVAALALLRSQGDSRQVRVTIDRSLPLAGGLGASAAASVGGAFGAAMAMGRPVSQAAILAAALVGESSVSSPHLDNIAPSLLGGVTVARSITPPDAVRVPVLGTWWVAVVSPAQRLTTKKARSVLPQLISQADFVHQIAHTAALITAFASGDHELAHRALVDIYAEPHRAGLIEAFFAVKSAAASAGALGCSISGAGPSVFALCASESIASACAAAMGAAFLPTAAQTHIGRIATEGARIL